MPNDNILMIRLMGTPAAITMAIKNLGLDPATVKRYANWRFNQGTERVFLTYDAATKKVQISGKQD